MPTYTCPDRLAHVHQATNETVAWAALSDPVSLLLLLLPLANTALLQDPTTPSVHTVPPVSPTNARATASPKQAKGLVGGVPSDPLNTWMPRVSADAGELFGELVRFRENACGGTWGTFDDECSKLVRMSHWAVAGSSTWDSLASTQREAALPWGEEVRPRPEAGSS